MNEAPTTEQHKTSIWVPTRREILGLGGVLAVGGGIAEGLAWWQRDERGMRARVFIGRAANYDANLAEVIAAGLSELGVTARELDGKSVLLKPNLVETAPGKSHINTHPAVVLAAAETLRRLGATVLVAEGQGHRRDSHLVLEESGMGDALDNGDLEFVDLNHDDVSEIPNAGSWTKMTSLHLPDTLLRADWVVSVAKLKTHHWAGVTCSMKNLFGVMPGVVYGWPKNVLHVAGIHRSILDINATVRPSLAIVDGIVGMDGDGPIMGRPKQAGCLILGRNATAVDATATRLMGLNPYGVAYLSAASGILGPVHDWNIQQCGERVADVRTPFELVDAPHLRSVRNHVGESA